MQKVQFIFSGWRRAVVVIAAAFAVAVAVAVAVLLLLSPLRSITISSSPKCDSFGVFEKQNMELDILNGALRNVCMHVCHVFLFALVHLCFYLYLSCVGVCMCM